MLEMSDGYKRLIESNKIAAFVLDRTAYYNIMRHTELKAGSCYFEYYDVMIKKLEEGIPKFYTPILSLLTYDLVEKDYTIFLINGNKVVEVTEDYHELVKRRYHQALVDNVFPVNL